MKIVNKKFSFLKPFYYKDLVRVGTNADGGYIVSKSEIKKAKYLISCGLGNEFSFENSLLKNKSITINIYDHTISFFSYLRLILKLFRHFITFRLKYSILIESLVNFYKYLLLINHNNVHHFSKKVSNNKKDANAITLKDILNLKSKNVIIKIDIEGSEFKILNELLKYKENFSMLIIEFHFIQKNKQIFINFFNEFLKFFTIIHVHGNNINSLNIYNVPDVLEITMIKKENDFKIKKRIINFPTKLDFPNNPHTKDLSFRFLN